MLRSALKCARTTACIKDVPRHVPVWVIASSCEHLSLISKRVIVAFLCIVALERAAGFIVHGYS